MNLLWLDRVTSEKVLILDCELAVCSEVIRNLLWVELVFSPVVFNLV